MKKIYKILSMLMALTIISSVAFCNSAFAKSTAKSTDKKSADKIYAANSEFKNKYGTAYTTFTYGMSRLYFDDGKTKNILARHMNDSIYMRGKSIYYVKDAKIFKIDNDGKNKKKLLDLYDPKSEFSNVYLICGYGKSVIFDKLVGATKEGYFKYEVCRLDGKKVTKIYKYTYDILHKRGSDWLYDDPYYPGTVLFNGKLYCMNNKVYNFKTGKVKSFVTKKFYATKDYLFYINKNNNLKRMDKSGKAVIIVRNVTDFHALNNKSDVIYEKNEAYYTLTNGKHYKLDSKKNLVDGFKYNDPASGYYEYDYPDVYAAYIRGGKIYMMFNLKYILTAPLDNPSNYKYLVELKKGEDEDFNEYYAYLRIKNDKLEYGSLMLEPDDFGGDD